LHGATEAALTDNAAFYKIKLARCTANFSGLLIYKILVAAKSLIVENEYWTEKGHGWHLISIGINMVSPNPDFGTRLRVRNLVRIKVVDIMAPG
jgi:hypothetical protein